MFIKDMIIILDFYVDEPACLGVPPYISPYCRYVAGVLVANGVSSEKILYLTVDQWRKNQKELTCDPELVILIGGSTVPGKYLGGKMGTVTEMLEFLDYRQKYQKNRLTILGGPIRYASDRILEQIALKNGLVIQGDVESAVDMIMKSSDISHGLDLYNSKRAQGNLAFQRDYQELNQWAVKGAFITRYHPNFPYLMIELETYRGCTRERYCSFCSEVFYGKPAFRSIEGIVAEVEELYSLGNRYFRLGRQADLFTYGADLKRYKNGFPKPNPEKLENLYSEIRRVAPDLKVLHLDNVNPGTVALFPQESLEIATIISRYNTSGDTAAMGLESVDPVVFELNSLKCSRQEAVRAIEIINEVGANRCDGIPKLLPGLNLIHGLSGESDRTFQQNFEFLSEILERNLLLRRINIRQVTVHSRTKLEQLKNDNNLSKKLNLSKKRIRPAILENKFTYFRDKIRKEIDRPMLEKVFPPGTILKEVIPEVSNPGYVLGRQLGSYPVTVKIPIDDMGAVIALESRQPIDVIITGYGERSILGLVYPIRINAIGQKALSQIPGVGKRRASNILLAKPIKNMDDLVKQVEEAVFGTLTDYTF